MGAYGKDAQRHHLDYIQRDSAAREGEKGILYSRDDIFLDGEKFHERGIDDRHQFRVIVSPEDGKELGKGSTLIIPRDYISHGFREAGEHIATLELGPSTQIDVAKKFGSFR